MHRHQVAIEGGKTDFASDQFKEAIAYSKSILQQRSRRQQPDYNFADEEKKDAPDADMTRSTVMSLSSAHARRPKEATRYWVRLQLMHQVRDSEPLRQYPLRLLLTEKKEQRNSSISSMQAEVSVNPEQNSRVSSQTKT